MAITTNDLKNGMSLNLSEGLYQVVEFQHVKPGKGGAFVRTTLRNLRTGNSLDKTFRAGEKVVLFYNSANRDEAAFVNPFAFDVTRSPNDHLGFGGGGTH